MTFISSVIAKQGIILAADSKELIQGGQLLWKDFDDILKLKNTNEDDTKFCISPKEIKDKFKENAQLTDGRVKSTDGAKKIFQLGSHSAILISGNANPAGQEYSEIIERIKSKVSSSGDNSFQKIIETTFAELSAILTVDISDDKHQTEFLVCGFDEADSKFKVYRFAFTDKLVMDEEGNAKRTATGGLIKEKIFKQFERNVLLNTSGWTDFVGELGTINNLSLEIELSQAFELSKKIMDLVVAIESIRHSITGIGGKIYFAAITADGFFWVNSETDVMNLLRQK
ncbi:MAG: hypothetical protein HY840_12615 [Bacteroidetes bacterium]|nr:hypothetical protein [Bacteroidota bacterium]